MTENDAYKIIDDYLSDIRSLENISDDKKIYLRDMIRREIRRCKMDYVSVIESENYQEYLENNRKRNYFIRNIVEDIDSDSDAYLFYLGNLYALINAYMKEVDRINEERGKFTRGTRILKRRYTKEILKKIYTDKYVQQREICKVLNLKANNISKKMEYLVRQDIVRRSIEGKYVFYSLTGVGKMLASTFMSNDSKVVIDGVAREVQNRPMISFKTVGTGVSNRYTMMDRFEKEKMVSNNKDYIAVNTNFKGDYRGNKRNYISAGSI